VVDDLEENLVALKALLDAPDVEVLQAQSGMRALELLLEHDVAVALLDVQMPEMDGFELAELMRGSERTRHVPILFLTAGLSDEQRQFKGYESGAVDFLQKPIQPIVLRSKLEVFFQLYRQRRQLARELAERNRTLQLQEMFTAVLGHDLRSPLSAVVFAAAMLEKHADPAVRAQGEMIGQVSWRMSRMIADLLDMARIRLAGGVAIARAPLDLAPLLQRVRAEVCAAHAEASVEIVTRGDLYGEWDEDRMVQVLHNLIGNALRHGEPGATVTVTVDGTDAAVVDVAVENRGSVPATVVESLFDPFAGGRERRAGAGLGLGLYIVKSLVAAHGGSVALRPSAPGTTVFGFRLPRR
jgi:signal transduction histidine kinase